VTAGAALARCIEPVEVEHFIQRYWEREPLIVRRDEPARFDGLLSLDEVERLVCSGEIRYPAFRLVKAGAQLSPREYTVDIPWRPAPFAGAPNVERILAEFEAGATIVIQGLHHYWHPLAVFCRELEAVFGHPVQANAYYTPSAAQGLAVHHDTHDVIVLQVAGEKRWLVYEPVLELPLKDQHYSAELGPPGATVHDVTLRAGDTLYLPRGWLHEALTSDADSLHLTIGVNLYTWLDAFRAAIESCADDLEFRRSVPGDGESAAGLLERVGERLAPEQVAARMRDRFVRTRRAILDGQLTQLRAAATVGLDTPLLRRPTVVADLHADGDSVTLAYAGKRVRFPGHVRDDLAFVLSATESFTLADLPGNLDENGRQVLARRLVREGLLLVRPEARDAPPSRNGGGAAV
jgi:hypothetical protein